MTNEVVIKNNNVDLSIEDEDGKFRRIDKATLIRRVRAMTFYDYYVWYISNNKLNKVRDVTYEKYDLVARDLKKIADGMLLVDLENNRSNLQWILDKYGKTHRRKTWLDFKGKVLQGLRFAVEDGYISGFAQSGLAINTVEHTWDDKTFTGFIPTKNVSSIRDVTVDPTIIGLIRRYIDFKHKYFPDMDVNLPIFLESKDTFFYNDVVNGNLYAIEKKLNIERLSIHKLRHSYASYLIFQGIPETVIAKQLGHTDTNMLHRVYGHLLEEQAEAGSSKIRGLMG